MHQLSLANAIELVGDPATSETVRFIRMFDRWFDCMNVSSLSGGRRELKKDLYPYRTPKDTRFDVSMHVIVLGYDNNVHMFIIVA